MQSDDWTFGFLLAVNLLVVLAAWQLVGGNFFGLFNLQSMGAQVPEMGLLALGVMLAMVSGNGGIDLSGIAVANLAGILGFLLAPLVVTPAEAPHLYIAVFCAIALVVGVGAGAVNGVLIAFVGLTPIIATLGTQLLFTGIAVGITGGSAQRLGWIAPFDTLGNGSVWGVPIPFAIFLGVACVLAAVLRFSAFGTRLYLQGTNMRAAHFSGIPVRRMLLATYTIAGVLAAVAGIIIAARTSSVKWDYGSSYVLIAVLIAVMAGARPEGGQGRIFCVVLAATALQILSSMFNFMGLSNFLRDFAWGLLLLGFLALARVNPLAFLRPLDRATQG